jgi:hypothetical protein
MRLLHFAGQRLPGLYDFMGGAASTLFCSYSPWLFLCST